MNRKIAAANWLEVEAPPVVTETEPSLVPAARPVTRRAAPAPARDTAPSATMARRRHDSAAWRRILSLAAFIVVVGFWAVAFRPTWLGGSATVLAVRGVSMEPTYQYGDVIVAQRRSQYETGDVIAYRVPEGEVGSGTVVIHRIVGGDAVTGLTTQGDGNPDPDDWHPTASDIIGAAGWRIPAVGRLLSVLRSVPGIGALTGAVAALLVFFGMGPTTPRDPIYTASSRPPSW